MAGQAIAHASRAVTERARGAYDPEQIRLIKHTIMPDGSNDGELALFLEVSARYELDPFSGQIWPVKYKGKIRNVVAKDGWLAVANRYDDFRGCHSDVVREHDYFDKKVEDGHVVIDHRYRDEHGEPTHGGPDGELRGPIVGGYAFVRRERHVDTYFYAFRKRYDKAEHTWASHPDAMMQKVAEAMALRKAYPLSGLYSEFEVPADANVTNMTQPSPAPIAWGDDEDLARQLQEAFSYLGYTHAKARMVMAGCQSKENREEVLARLQAEAEAAPIEGTATDETVTPA